jgi:hypothetical protein
VADFTFEEADLVEGCGTGNIHTITAGDSDLICFTDQWRFPGNLLWNDWAVPIFPSPGSTDYEVQKGGTEGVFVDWLLRFSYVLPDPENCFVASSLELAQGPSPSIDASSVVGLHVYGFQTFTVDPVHNMTVDVAGATLFGITKHTCSGTTPEAMTAAIAYAIGTGPAVSAELDSGTFDGCFIYHRTFRIVCTPPEEPTQYGWGILTS